MPLTDLDKALADAQKAYDDGVTALKNNDFQAYGEAQKRLADAIKRAQSLATAAAATPTPSASESPTPTATESAAALAATPTAAAALRPLPR